MRSRFVPLALLLAVAPSRAHAIPRPPERPQPKQTTVRVLLGYHARAVIQGYDLQANGETLPGTSIFNLRCGSEPESHVAYVEYGAGKRAVGRLELHAPGGFLSLNDRQYRAHLSVIPQGNACEITNTVDIEKYVAGVIAKEMAPGWPLEALKAQAVASRSYALFQTQANKQKDFDVENGTQDQVYEGSSSESPKTIMATEATRGQALVYGDSALKAYFHANCGGITEVPELVWGGEPRAFRAVVCPYHHKPRDHVAWSALITRSQIEGALRRIAGLLPRGFRKVASLAEGAPDGSHRLSDVTVSDSVGNTVLINSNTFRNALGNTRVKSTSFHIHKDHDGYRIDGEGNGHGVGLCQVGARAMAEEGKTYRQILQFYYPLAKIQPLK
jgi:stage II sporulation protein D